jgi:hypothetical protein
VSNVPPPNIPHTQNLQNVPLSFRKPTQFQVFGEGFLKSSFIDDLAYDISTRTCYVEIERKWYAYSMEYPQYLRFLAGQAVCVTKDPTGMNRWHPSKTPSQGAFYNQFVKIGGIRGWRAGRVLWAKIKGSIQARKEKNKSKEKKIQQWKLPKHFKPHQPTATGATDEQLRRMGL